MYAYVDESGHTGLRMFDADQPGLYYGVVVSPVDIDLFLKPAFEQFRRRFGVERLHANELGAARIAEIAPDLIEQARRYSIVFDHHKVVKADCALIQFFDQVFDAGVNRAVPWTAYWTPLRYVLLMKVAYLFDEDVLQRAWAARIDLNSERSDAAMQAVCTELLSRVGMLPDERSRDVISGALRWAVANPKEISYGTLDKGHLKQVSPNLVGFQYVLMTLAHRLIKKRARCRAIVIDQQQEFNRAQDSLSQYYVASAGQRYRLGPGLPEMDLRGMPKNALTFRSSRESVGLELVDLLLWVAKRWHEGRLDERLYNLWRFLAKRGLYDEMSLSAISNRWEHLLHLPEPSAKELEFAKALMQEQEQRRQAALVGL